MPLLKNTLKFKSLAFIFLMFSLSFLSCNQGNSNEYSTNSNNSNEPVIKTFSILPASVNSPFTMNLIWNIDDPNHQYACKIDFEGDGIYDYETNDCSKNNSIVHKFDNTGFYTIKLAVIDKNTNIVKKITTITIQITEETPTNKSDELYLLHITKKGNGFVISNPAGIDCGTECESFFQNGKTINLKATPSNNSGSVKWTGDCSSCGNSTTCSVILDTDKDCNVIFGSSNIQNQNPVINNFTVSATTGQIPLPVTFSWSVSDPDKDPLNCKLDVDGDGTFDYNFDNCSQQSIQHTYSKAGTYFAKLSVKDSKGGYIERTVQIEVKKQGSSTNHNPAVAFFKANPTNGEAPLTVNFNWKVIDIDGDSLTCKFDVDGDGTFDYNFDNCSEESLQYTYDSAGAYDSHLVVVDGKGGFYQVNALITVTSSGNTEPVLYLIRVYKEGNGNGNVSSNPAGINCGTECESFFEEGKTIQLIAKPDNSSKIDKWTEDCSSCGSNLVCSIMLNTDKNCGVIFKTKPQNHKPTITQFNVNPTSGYAPLTVTMSWNVSDIDGDNLTCKLDVNGDGSYDYTINNCSTGSKQYTYQNAGYYNVKFVVIDSKGAENTAQKYVNVETMPCPSISIKAPHYPDTYEICSVLDIQLTAQGGGAPYRWKVQTDSQLDKILNIDCKGSSCHLRGILNVRYYDPYIKVVLTNSCGNSAQWKYTFNVVDHSGCSSGIKVTFDQSNGRYCYEDKNGKHFWASGLTVRPGDPSYGIWVNNQYCIYSQNCNVDYCSLLNVNTGCSVTIYNAGNSYYGQCGYR